VSAPSGASAGKKFLIFIIFLILLGIGLVYANLNGYIDLPLSITKFIPIQYLPAVDIAEVVTEAPPATEPYKEEPETYEEEMATYEKESYKDETEAYEEENYVDEGAPEAYTS
jgi:hypothetical protein